MSSDTARDQGGVVLLGQTLDTGRGTVLVPQRLMPVDDQRIRQHMEVRKPGRSELRGQSAQLRTQRLGRQVQLLARTLDLRHPDSPIIKPLGHSDSRPIGFHHPSTKSWKPRQSGSCNGQAGCGVRSALGVDGSGSQYPGPGAGTPNAVHKQSSVQEPENTGSP
ncbi:hypothetical protein [Streptomyces sp. NPDC020362]|uniref:hypothetical protein n=1 Tax=unclassified Streptomyces TaxID=2593676 RepID=UPI0033EF8CBE